MSLQFDGEWRFDPPADGTYVNREIPRDAVEEFVGLIMKVATQGDQQKIIEHFKGYFRQASGSIHVWSSSPSWAETDLREAASDAATNAPLFIEAFYEACQSLASGKPPMSVPTPEKINRVLEDHRVGYEIQLPKLVLRDQNVQQVRPTEPRPAVSRPPIVPASGGTVAASQSELTRLMKAVEDAVSPDEKGKSLEALCAALFAAIPGFDVRGRIRTATEEIDLRIVNGSSDHRLKREGAIVLVECKNWTSKCGKDEIVIFREKIENRTNRCTLGFLVSWNGFAGTVEREMLRGSRGDILIVPIDGDHVRKAVRSGDFESVLLEEWEKAVFL